MTISVESKQCPSCGSCRFDVVEPSRGSYVATCAACYAGPPDDHGEGATMIAAVIDLCECLDYDDACLTPAQRNSALLARALGGFVR